MINYSTIPAAIQHDDDDLAGFVRFALVVGLTKKATKRRRRSIKRDRETLAMARVLTPLTIPAVSTSLVLNPTTPLSPLTSSSTTPLTSPITPLEDSLDSRDRPKAGTGRAKRAKASVIGTSPLTESKPANDNVDTRDPPSWPYTTSVIKAHFANRALALHGEVCSFSLNLSQDEIDKALASPKGFAGYFREAINRAMKRALGYKPKFWIAVDITDAGRLHLHGGMAIRQRNEVCLALDALPDAGGEWDHARGGEYQAHIDRQTDPDGWARYAIRERAKVRLIVGDRQTHAIANGLIGDARALYEGWRRQVTNRHG